MKINPTGSANYIQGGYRTGKLDSYKKSQSAGRSDSALLSGEAVAFSKVMASIRESDPALNPEEQSRVADIKSQVQSGEYRVDSSDIADSILGDLFG